MANDIDEATKIARAFFNNWYGDYGEDNSDSNNPDCFEYSSGTALRINSIAPITRMEWIKQTLDRFTIANNGSQCCELNKVTRIGEY